MAGDWIKLRKSVLTHPRLVRTMSALNADRLRTLGGIVSAWCLLDEQSADGKLDGYTPEILDELVGLQGLSRAMEAAGWLIITEKGLEAPEFEKHNGATAKRRAQENDRKMSARNADKHTQPKQTNCGPEKRREEKRRDTPSGAVDDAAFEAFYQAYPRKRDKGAAKRAWAKAIKTTTPETIMAGLERAKASPEWAGKELQYIKFPATWLNAEGWADELPIATTAPITPASRPFDPSEWQ